MVMETAAHERDVTKAIRKSNLIDGFLCCRYSFSPYMACGHGCSYCDGRAEKYWVEGDFERDIVVRRNVPQLLADELPRLRERAPIAIGSGISDAYQPVEEDRGIMAACAGILAQGRMPVSLLTKSSRVCRDIDLWDKVNTGPGFILNLTITTLDDTVRQEFEPGASPVSERLGTLRAFRNRGIPVGVMAMPLLPFISDGEEDVHKLVRTLKEAGAAFVMPAGLTLRPGRQKEFFLSRLVQSHPGLVERYREIYGEERQSGVCNKTYRTALHERISSAVKEELVPFLLPHSFYRDRLPLYDELHLLLQHMAELYAERDVPISGLTAATRRYTGWLLEKKKVFNRRRSLRQEELEGETRSLFQTDAAQRLLGNEKLTAFLSQVALERKVFDYLSLSLTVRS